jgi:hypothetical protein
MRSNKPHGPIPGGSMRMPLVQVGMVRMALDQPDMPVLVHVRCVMHMDVPMLQRLVFVQMLLGQVQPEAIFPRF